MKSDICADIIRSPHFNHKLQVDLINPTDRGIYKILKEHYPNIHKDLYIERNSSAVLTNPYRKRDIVVGKRVVNAFVFSCLAFDRESGNITQYLISKIHLLNTDSCRHHKDQMKGVFIFAESGEKTVVIALGEQPGYVINPTDTQFSFDLTVPEGTNGKYLYLFKVVSPNRSA